MKTINSHVLKKKKILLRVDLNVPVVNGLITDRSRIESIKSTIKKLKDGQNKIFLISHYGRPKGKINKKLSLEFLRPILCEEFDIKKIFFLKSIDNNLIKKMQHEMALGDICLMENIRFYKNEEENNIDFSKNLSELFDVYVNDAFSASHRKHASIVGIPNFLPSFAGDNLLYEINNLNIFLDKPMKPNTSIIGGSKISTKIEILNNLVENFNNIIIGGAMANTFLLAEGIEIGKSVVEKEMLTIAKKIKDKAKNFNCKIILPIDVVCANNLKDISNIRRCNVKNILPNQMILDLGEETLKLIISILLKSNSILWNGPLGAFEYKPFDYSTIEIANFFKKKLKNIHVKTLVGGGDTISAIKMAKAENSFTYTSNAGGAFLEWLAGKESPGIQALKLNNLN
tara:strand:+ start:836 stop:2035 length:1200 start_codon:yes stop_codon:yes gene_type:complete